ncbi:MAG: NERD domain-containing protein [Nitrososphaerota archaeon]|nr:NERD domain-containing protein [Nitrososphaerota archaeon]
MLIFRYYQHKYHIYKSGRQGEKTVIKKLTNKLNDEYTLINSVYLKKGGGDIDHIILGPTGIYVLETKNWSGKIICNGTQWQRPGKKLQNNPSVQVRNNTQKIKKMVDSSPLFQGLNIYVEGLIVFTNTHANLSINNSTVPVLRIQQLPDYIKNQKNNRLTKEQVQQIVKQIQDA